MFHAARHHNELAFLDPLVAVEEFHAKASLYDQKHFVFVVVMMKHELAFGLHEFDVLAVQLGGDGRLVVFRDFSELFRDIDFLHGFAPLEKLWLHSCIRAV
jgi:hypothetical protein